MEYQGDIGLYLSGEPVRVKTCGFYINQPRVRDIVKFGESDFFTVAKMLSDPKSFADKMREGKTVLADASDFQIIIGVLGSKEKTALSIMFDNFLELCFPDFVVEITRKSINFKVDKDSPTVGQLNPFNYKDFAITLKELFLPEDAQSEEPEYNIDSTNKRAVELREKILRNRKKLEKAKQSEDGGGFHSVFAVYTSVLSIGLDCNINTIYNYTPFQLYDAFKRYIQKEQYKFYQSLLTVPFMDSSKIDPVDDWFHDLYQPKPPEFNSMSKIEGISGMA